MTIGEWITLAEKKLHSIDDEKELRSILRYWLKERINLLPHEWITRRNEQLTQIDLLQKDLEQLQTAKPIQYILGYEWFDGLKLTVSPAVLIPRPETEELVRWIIETEVDVSAKIADLCTGSGCIALSLQKRFPEATVCGWDYSENALTIAKQNALQLNLPVQFYQANLLESFASFPEFRSVQVIVANPPYVLESEASEIHPNVLHFEPHLALFVPTNDPIVFYRNIVQEANLLPSVRSIYFELNPKTAEQVAQLGKQYGWEVEIRLDFQKKTRMMRLWKAL